MAAWNATAVRTPIFPVDSQWGCCVLRWWVEAWLRLHGKWIQEKVNGRYSNSDRIYAFKILKMEECGGIFRQTWIGIGLLGTLNKAALLMSPWSCSEQHNLKNHQWSKIFEGDWNAHEETYVFSREIYSKWKKIRGWDLHEATKNTEGTNVYTIPNRFRNNEIDHQVPVWHGFTFRKGVPGIAYFRWCTSQRKFHCAGHLEITRIGYSLTPIPGSSAQLVFPLNPSAL